MFRKIAMCMALAFAATTALGKADFPAVSHDGLHLMPDTKVLSTEGGHHVVMDAGTGVLILRPAIINLDDTAPDVMSAGMNQTYVASAGSMTLYLELYDGKTQAIIARIIDPRAANSAGIAEVANSVTNTADFDRILLRWARLLNDHLAKLKKAK